jgi:hypothetical protein
MTRTSVSHRHIIYLLAHGVVFASGAAIVQHDGDGWKAVGTSVMATAIAGWALFAYIVVTDRWTDRLQALTQFGLTSIFPARSTRIREVYETRLSKVDKNIDLLGFGQSSFREDYLSHFGTWLAKGVQIRILLLDPTFPRQDVSYAMQRDNEERNPPDSITRDVEAFLRETQQLRSDNAAFRVRLYRCLPTINIFRIDDYLFWGPYLVGEQSRNMPTFLVQRGGLLYQRMLQHFDDIWENPGLSQPPVG